MDIEKHTRIKVETTIDRSEVEEILSMTFRLEANLPPSAEVEFSWSTTGMVTISTTSEETKAVNRVDAR